MTNYIILKQQKFDLKNYSIVPIRFQDRYLIMKWRNEQIYHLRQKGKLTKIDQDAYFENVISKTFDEKYPDQILFSFLEGSKCIGYGGLVHINWEDKNAEISFIIETSLEALYFEKHWATFLKLIEEVGFNGLLLYKLYTYAFDIRPHLYLVLEKSHFLKEAVLKEHCFFSGKFIDVVIHSKRNYID
jgi:RimJ/RimL family protein N-acetyltransferase